MWESNPKRRSMPQCNRNQGLWVAGLKAQEVLPSVEAQNFIKALVEYHPRCRTSADFERLSLEFLERWRQIVELWGGLDYLTEELDFGERQKLRTDFFDNLTRKNVQSHAELRTI